MVLVPFSTLIEIVILAKPEDQGVGELLTTPGGENTISLTLLRFS
jgi:hypothetical protein